MINTKVCCRIMIQIVAKVLSWNISDETWLIACNLQFDTLSTNLYYRNLVKHCMFLCFFVLECTVKKLRNVCTSSSSVLHQILYLHLLAFWFRSWWLTWRIPSKYLVCKTQWKGKAEPSTEALQVPKRWGYGKIHFKCHLFPLVEKPI